MNKFRAITKRPSRYKIIIHPSRYKIIIHPSRYKTLPRSHQNGYPGFQRGFAGWSILVVSCSRYGSETTP